MDGASAAGRNIGEFARIETTLDGDFTHTLRHVVAGHAVHARRGLLNRQAHRFGDVFLDGGAGRCHVQAHLAAGKEAGIEIAQHDVGIGRCRQFAALGVAGRSGVGTRAVRPHTQHATLVQPANGATARAYGVDVEHR